MPTGNETAVLVAKVLAGERDAFACLVRSHLRAAYLAALAVVGRPSDAEDVTQDAFLVAFERLDTCREPVRFSGWLLRIVRNRALNWVEERARREARGQARAADPDPTQESLPDAGLRKQLLEALAGLTVAQREVVLLHEVEGWSHAEIAEAVGMSEVMSRQHLLTARRKLQERLGQSALMEVRHGR